MTIKEYISGVLKVFQVSESDVLFITSLNNLNAESELNTGNVKEVNIAIYNQVPLLWAGIQDVSEGGYSVKHNHTAILAWYRLFAKQLGKPDQLTERPKLKNITNRW